MGAGRPLQLLPTLGVSVITTEGEKSADDNSTINLPSVLAGMEHHEALAFVSRLYDHAKAGHSFWGDKFCCANSLGSAAAPTVLKHAAGTCVSCGISHVGATGTIPIRCCLILITIDILSLVARDVMILILKKMCVAHCSLIINYSVVVAI